MRRSAFLLSAVLLGACGSGRAPGPCGPCASPTGAGSLGVVPERSARLQALASQRVALARKRLVLLRASFDHGDVSIDAVFSGCRDVAFAARDSGMHGPELRDVLTDYRDAVVALRDLTRERVSSGKVNEEGLSRVEALVAEADFWLEEAIEGAPLR